ncbi:MAG: shikimate kinase [Propionibacteriaceae bacterium]
MSILLIGVPGSGKSTVAPLLAQLLKVPVLDTDFKVEQRCERSASDIFIEHGEQMFRSMEQQVCEEILLDSLDSVVAMGSGALLSPAVASLLASHYVIWLDVTAAQALKRTGFDIARPTQLGNVRGMFIQMMKQRTVVYKKYADIRIDVSDIEPSHVAQVAMTALKKH